MKLLLAADIFPPQSGGPATYVVTLANELAKQGIEVRIVSLNPISDRSAVSCALYHVTRNNKLLRYAQYFLLLFREAKHVDVVYAMGPVNAGLPALIAARLRGKKFVVKVVGDYAWEQYQQLVINPSAIEFALRRSRAGNQQSALLMIDEFQKIKVMRVKGKIAWLKRFESSVFSHADRVITPCAYLKRMVVGWGAREENVSVVYNAISIPTITPKDKPAGEQWVVSIGRDVPWKGMKTLSEIMQDFPQNIKLKIITNAPRQEALSYLAAADVFVLNSGYEGLSHVLLEAIGLGIPVLASNVGGNPEIVSTKYLFPYNDRGAIREKLIHALSQSGPRSIHLADQFNLPTMIKLTKELLESVCQYS